MTMRRVLAGLIASPLLAGCYMTLPTSAAAGADTLAVCESCGRILIWR